MGGVMGILLKATWPNLGRECTYYVPGSMIDRAFDSFKTTGKARVELETVQTGVRRKPAGITHIKERF